MKKRVLIFILTIVMILGMATTALAVGPSATPGTGGGAVTPPSSGDALSINSAHKDGDMNASYSEGYSPMLRNSSAIIVVPLNVDMAKLMSGTTQLVTTINLGTLGDPFVMNNYDRNVSISGNQCVIKYDVPLTWPRTNGAYPVTITASYMTTDGSPESQSFLVYVTITDGPVSPQPTPTPTSSEGPVSQPKVIMSDYTVTPDPVYAGDVFTVVAVLQNTSKSSAIKNMSVSYKSQTTDLIPDDGASTSFIDGIAAGGTAQFTFKMKARADAKPGPQKIDVALSYEDGKANPYTATDEITVQVRQKIRLEFDEPKFPTGVYMGDTVSATLNLYNKGKNMLYNVTVVLDVPGIKPDTSAFLGNMESGASKNADIYGTVESSAGRMDMGDMSAVDGGATAASAVGVIGGADDPTSIIIAGEATAPENGALAGDEGDTTPIEGGIMPGQVEGNFIVTYEDEYGDSYEKKIPVKTEIMEMVPMDPGMVDPGMEQPEASVGFPWWAWVIIAGVAVVVVVVVVRNRKKAKREKELMEDMDDDDIS